MMDCLTVERLFAAWERGELVPLSDFREARQHIDSCASCADRYGALSLLLAHDSGDLSIGYPPLAGVNEEAAARSSSRIADAVIAEIRVGKRRKARAFAMVAALAIFAVGLGLGRLWGGRNDPELVSVHFVLDAPEAREVFLVGDFNGWAIGPNTLTKAKDDGLWEIHLDLKRGRMYTYNFVIDGNRWILDPAVPEAVDDGFGGSGSLLKL